MFILNKEYKPFTFIKGARPNTILFKVYLKLTNLNNAQL